MHKKVANKKLQKVATRPRATKFARQVPILRDFALLSSLSDCTESEKDCGFGCGVFLDGESREEF